MPRALAPSQYRRGPRGFARTPRRADMSTNVLLPQWGMNMEDAYEYFDFNIRCAYVVEQTPIWCNDDM